MNLPAENTHALIDALRDELQEYGALFHQLRDQQEFLVRQQAEETLTCSRLIEVQLVVLLSARQRRQEEMQSLAGPNHPRDECPIRIATLLPYFCSTVAPMIVGLVEEINRLIAQVSRLAQQNQVLLLRAVELTQAALQKAQPGLATKTYSAAGKMLLRIVA